jgi:hypothetical protein
MPNTRRAPAHTNTYELTPDGIRVAFFYTKVDDRLLSRCWPAIQLPRHSSFEVPFEPDRSVDAYVTAAPVKEAR